MVLHGPGQNPSERAGFRSQTTGPVPSAGGASAYLLFLEVDCQFSVRTAAANLEYDDQPKLLRTWRFWGPVGPVGQGSGDWGGRSP